MSSHFSMTFIGFLVPFYSLILIFSDTFSILIALSHIIHRPAISFCCPLNTLLEFFIIISQLLIKQTEAFYSIRYMISLHLSQNIIPINGFIQILTNICLAPICIRQVIDPTPIPSFCRLLKPMLCLFGYIQMTQRNIGEMIQIGQSITQFMLCHHISGLCQRKYLGNDSLHYIFLNVFFLISQIQLTQHFSFFCAFMMILEA